MAGKPSEQEELTMKGKIALLVGGAAGYVLGTRAGRERYEQIKSQAQSVWNNPKVQEKAAKAQDLAKDKASQATGGSGSSGEDGFGSEDGLGTVGEDALSEPAPYPTSASTGL
jgi:hypothetical protein